MWSQTDIPLGKGNINLSRVERDAINTPIVLASDNYLVNQGMILMQQKLILLYVKLTGFLFHLSIN